MFRAFLESWLSGSADYECVCAARTGEEALASLDTLAPEVLMVDLQLPGLDGLAVAREARRRFPGLRTLVLSSLLDPLSVTRVAEGAVDGFVEKDAEPAVLREALDAVAAGRAWYSPKFTELRARSLAGAGAVGRVLTRREQEVLSLVIEGRTGREIADSLGLSVRTVEFHRANLMGKLGADSLAGLIRAAGRRA